ncbi:beta-lactamase-like protein [Obelidium mucronatum]|nr:beta-lactamase-like protein [Obelidium mucronatum]
MEALVRLPPIQTLSPLVSVIRGLNPGKFTLQGTNTYLVGTGKRRILIDSGQGVPEYLGLLQQALQERGNVSISDILITHRHHDHVGGIQQVLQANPHTNVNIWKRMTSVDNNANGEIPPYKHILENQIFETEGASLQSIYTPGHLDDHVVFYLKQEAALFSGDSVLGQGSTTFENLKQYMDSLTKTLELCVNIDVIYPGHGPDLKNGTMVVKNYMQHRIDRENEILNVLKCGGKAGFFTSRDIVEVVYADYDRNIWPAAERSVVLHLNKLLEEGRIQQTERLGDKVYFIASTLPRHGL